MMTYWVALDRPVLYRGAMRQAFSVDGDTEGAASANIKEAIGQIRAGEVQVLSIRPLPYPGEPRLGYRSGDCPSFCMHPAKCAGRTSCPRNIACSE
jgi:hypothetical protein